MFIFLFLLLQYFFLLLYFQLNVSTYKEAETKNMTLKVYLCQSENSCQEDSDPSNLGYELISAFVTSMFLKAKRHHKEWADIKLFVRNFHWFTEMTLISDWLYTVWAMVSCVWHCQVNLQPLMGQLAVSRQHS